jgi:integrase
MAALINAQLESDQATLLSFEPISIPQLRDRWLDHHEHVLRSSVHTISRYRTATDHLLRFLEHYPIKLASLFNSRAAEAFVRYLRTIEVAPNGHKNSAKRRLLDKGVKYILECCRALFGYAAKRRHLSAYAENPFIVIEVDRMPVEDAKPIVLLTAEQEKQFLEECDDWQFPIFLTLMLTGLRPGELCHLLVSDVDLEAGILRVRNKPQLGWQIKTRSERDLPLVPVLADVLRQLIGTRRSGCLFRQRRFDSKVEIPALQHLDPERLIAEAAGRLAAAQATLGGTLTRVRQLLVLRTIWRDLGALKEDRVRTEFIRVCRRIGLPHLSAPKLLRHGFATALQDANVDHLVRNLLMGHAPVGSGAPGGGLGMTAVYTHTRPETIRKQLDAAMAVRPLLVAAARRWSGIRFREVAA